MSLSVHVWVVDETEPGKVRVLAAPSGASTLAGFEATRTKLWGSPVVRSLGVSLLPQLAEGDLWVSNDQVEAFAAECALVLANRAAIASASGYDEEYIESRSTNMVDAARRALDARGGVVVW